MDASVVVKWLVPEALSDKAVALLENHELIAPDLVLPEVGNVLWKLQRREELNDVEALTAIESLQPPPFEIHASEKLLPSAYLIAARYDRTAYDGLYMALAVASRTQMVTDDRKLVNAMATTELASSLLWLGNLGKSGTLNPPPPASSTGTLTPIGIS